MKSNTLRSFILRTIKPVRCLAALGYLCLLALPAQAKHDNKPGLILQPYSAEYTAEVRGFDLSATRSLQFTSNNQWELRHDFSHWLASLVESSHFKLITSPSGQTLQSQHYQFRRSVFGKTKHIELDLDRDKQLLSEDYDGRKSQLSPIPDNIYDSLSQHVQLRLDLLQGKRDNLIYQVYKKGQIKTYQYRVQGEEEIKLPAGRFKALKLATDSKSQRQTTVWMALDWDLLILKIQHKEKKDSYSLSLKHAQLGQLEIGSSDDEDEDDDF